MLQDEEENVNWKMTLLNDTFNLILSSDEDLGFIPVFTFIEDEDYIQSDGLSFDELYGIPSEHADAIYVVHAQSSKAHKIEGMNNSRNWDSNLLLNVAQITILQADLQYAKMYVEELQQSKEAGSEDYNEETEKELVKQIEEWEY